MLRMDQVYVVRHKVLIEGQSERKVAREMGISRNTVKRYVGGAEPGVRQTVARAADVKERVRPRLEQLLAEAPTWTGGKQRLTAARLHRMLVEEGHAVSDRVVREMVAEWKRQRLEVFVPLVYKPGDLAEVDFFEVLVTVAGTRQKAWMFVMRLMHSGRDFAWLYPRQDQVAFLDGHVRAFEHFGAVPHRIAYDNLRPAVTRVLVGSERELSARFQAITTHYLFEPSFARPRTGHDKGGVEARGKGIRWQELVPVPSGPDLCTISSSLLQRLDGRMEATRDPQGRSIWERFVAERGRMLPLPGRPFRAASFHHAAVTRRSLVSLHGAVYSVWTDWVKLSVKAYVGVDQVEIVGPDGRRVAHPRQPCGGRSVDYRHYLPELAKKPQAVRQVADELIRDLGTPFDVLWRQLVDERGPKQAARIFAHVLRAVTELGHEATAERVKRALASGEPVLLALRPAQSLLPAVAVEQLPTRWQTIDVAQGCAADYDALLIGGGR
jgi:transposase